MNIPTPHIEAKKGDFAKTVLMPGDPLRARFIAEHYLEDAVLDNSVRQMSGYTGTYKGKRVSVGDAGSGVEFNARQILEAYGISFDDIEVNNLGFGDSSDALKDGKIDAFFCTAGAPTTAIVELATTNSINLLEIDDEHAAALAEAHPFYTTYPIPGGSYKGVDEDVQTVAIKATLICSPKLSEETVYNLTKALFDNQSEIAAAHAKGEELSLEYAVSGISVPFHPGAEKYFKEVGAIK